MKWTIEKLHLLAKRVYGNCSEESILRKLAEMRVHLNKYEKPFFHHDKHEWAEVERLANEIYELARPLLKHGICDGEISVTLDPWLIGRIFIWDSNGRRASTSKLHK